MAGSNFGDEYKGYDSKILIFHSLQHILHKISGGLLHLFLSNYLISQFYSSPIKTESLSKYATLISISILQ